MAHNGKLLRSYDAELSVLPVQRPYPPLWYASSNSATAEWAGRNSVNFVGRWNKGTVADTVRAYWKSWEEHRLSGDRLNSHVEEPRVGISGSVVIAASQEQAHDIFGRANELFAEQVLHLWHANDDHRLDEAFATGPQLATDAACVGTAEQVRDQVVHQVETAGVNYFEMLMFFGDMTFDEATFGLTAFTETVAPSVREAARRAGARR